MKIAIGSDHAGFESKQNVVSFLKNNGFDVTDVGTDSNQSCNYPDYALKAAKLVLDNECDFGVLICSTGEGICIAANKIKGIRCGIGYADDAARLLREHNDANMIAFGANLMSIEDICRRVLIFASTKFSFGERHIKRLDLIKELEK